MTNISQSVSPSAVLSEGSTIAQLVKQSSVRMARWPCLALLFMTLVPQLRGQALPAAEAAPISTGFALPRLAGTLNYAVSASESLTWGYYGNQGAYSATNLSGDLAYLSSSKLYPFSMVFSGGHAWSTSGEPSSSFLSLGLSQVVNVKRWSLLVSDSVSYLPGTPTLGLSGVAGVGDLGVSPVQVGNDIGQGVLTNFSSRVSNSVSGSVQRQITGKTSATAFGTYTLMRFLGTGGEGLDNSSVTGGGSISHELSARTSFGGSYSYSSFAYPGNSASIAQPGFTSQTASAQFTHQLTRKLSLALSAGPQWSGVDTAGSSRGLSAYANATLAYTGQFSHASLYYSRGTNSGYGAIGGALSQGGGVSVGRTFARVWSCAATASYTQSSNLPSANTASYSFDTAVAGVQMSRAIVRSISAFASYSFQYQSNSGAAAIDLFSGREQVVGFGVTYSPSSIRLGRQ